MNYGHVNSGFRLDTIYRLSPESRIALLAWVVRAKPNMIIDPTLAGLH